MLLIFRPYSVGDLIEAAGVEAVVEAIGLFSTTLNTKDNVKIHIPNGEIYGSVIKNLTANETRRIDMVFGVSYDDDLGVAKSTIERVLGDNPLVLEQPAPDVEVFELGDSSVNFLVRPWVKTDNYWEAHFSVHHELKEGLEAAGCSFPYPQREVHMHEM